MKPWEDPALKGDSDDGFKGNSSAIWNPSREQWFVIWVCAMTAWLLWSANNDGEYGILSILPFGTFVFDASLRREIESMKAVAARSPL